MEWIIVLVIGAVVIWYVLREKSQPSHKTQDEHSALEPGKYVMRQGEFVEADEAFDAWTSGDRESMLKALDAETNPVDRHFLLMNTVARLYKEREKPESAEMLRQVAEMHLSEFSEIKPVLKKEVGGVLPRVSTYQQYATLLTEKGEFNKAIEVCKEAINHGLRDGTKTGFKGRINRIKSKQAKAEPSLFTKF